MMMKFDKLYDKCNPSQHEIMPDSLQKFWVHYLPQHPVIDFVCQEILIGVVWSTDLKSLVIPWEIDSYSKHIAQLSFVLKRKFKLEIELILFLYLPYLCKHKRKLLRKIRLLDLEVRLISKSGVYIKKILFLTYNRLSTDRLNQNGQR